LTEVKGVKTTLTGVTVGGCVSSVLEDTDKVIETYLLILVI
jgi:hypothetical protein